MFEKGKEKLNGNSDKEKCGTHQQSVECRQPTKKTKQWVGGSKQKRDIK